MRFLCLFLALGFGSVLQAEEAFLDVESPFPKIALVKNAAGEIQQTVLKSARIEEDNLQGERSEGGVFLAARTSVVALLPVCPEQPGEYASQGIQTAIQFLERIPADLKAKAGITPKVLVRWDDLLKASKAREARQALEEQRKAAELKELQNSKLGQNRAKWLGEAKDFLRPRSGDQLDQLRKEGEDLLVQKVENAGEIEEYLAVLSQVLPVEKGGPLPELEKLNPLQAEVIPDEVLIWFGGGVYLVSLLLLLFGLSYLSNLFTSLQARVWAKAVLYGLLTPFFFAGLYYLWWPTHGRGSSCEPGESDQFKELANYIKNQIKPAYYFPAKEFVIPPGDLVNGFLAKMTPTEKTVGYLKGRMGVGRLTVENGKWWWSQGISLLGLPFEIPLLFEGGVPDPDNWNNPKIDRVKIGQLQVPEALASPISEAMLGTYRNALQSAGLQSLRMRAGDGNGLMIGIRSSGTRPVFQVEGKHQGSAEKSKVVRTHKKEITAEDLAKEYLAYLEGKEFLNYADRFILIEGYVRRVDSGNEYSGGSKASGGFGQKPNADQAGGQMAADRFDEFELENWTNDKVLIKCLLKSKSVFAMDSGTSQEADPQSVVPETGEPLRGGDIYWGPRANLIHDEPLIKRGQRVRFLTEGRVEFSKSSGKVLVLVKGIRLDDSSQISCYDPHQGIDFKPLAPVVVGDNDFDLDAKATSNLPVSFQSSDPAVAEIYKGRRVKIKKAGETVITATQEGNSSWLRASASQTLRVEPAR
ncbi:MAG: hypothetical protein EBT57_02005 [Verrucomicrobia bacterium]|nr:hypothetical protein [Verrucomicrobiota bacterium]